jgi:hypothetical protein
MCPCRPVCYQGGVSMLGRGLKLWDVFRGLVYERGCRVDCALLYRGKGVGGPSHWRRDLY